MMTSTLGVVVENAEVFAKILRNCGLPQVADWKLEDVNRAFSWVQYFQKVNQRIGSRTSVLKKLEYRVKEIGWTLGVRFGQEELSFRFLANDSHQFCIKALLGNPSLPDELRQHILSEHSNTPAPPDVRGEVSQALLTTLAKVYGTLKDSVADSDPTLGLHSLDAAYLWEDITWLLQASDVATTGLDLAEQTSLTAATRLTSLAQVDGGMEVILLALLQSSAGGTLVTGPCQVNTLDTARNFILEWLVKTAQTCNNTTESTSGSVPCTADAAAGSGTDAGTSELGRVLWSSRSQHQSLLVRASICFFSFFKEHLRFLVNETERLNTQLGAQHMCLMKKEQQANSGECLKWVVSQWVELVRGGSHVRDVCLQVIRSRAFTHLASYDTQPARNYLQQELSHADCMLQYPPTENKAWTEVLRTIEQVIKDHH